MNVSLEKCSVFNDYRGDLVQFITATYLSEKGVSLGQFYLLTFSHAQVIRGNHYHQSSSEVFCLMAGSVDLVCEDIVSKERFEKRLTVKDGFYYRVYVGENIAHAIRSISDFAVMASFSTQEYNQHMPDKIDYLLLS